jgi:hypothetical protein
MQNSKDNFGKSGQQLWIKENVEGQLRIPNNVVPYKVQNIFTKLIHLLNKI